MIVLLNLNYLLVSLLVNFTSFIPALYVAIEKMIIIIIMNYCVCVTANSVHLSLRSSWLIS